MEAAARALGMEEGRRAGALEALLQHEAVAAAVIAGAALGGDR